ncbi:PEGA domain-containing protein [bacterium]|nr:MAG: PEGA domain-containing protein [bacterium]
MTLRSRIFLIIGGVLIFAATAPVSIFFARGFTFDFANWKIVKTGTIVAKTDPRSADVFLGEKYLGSSPLTKRFVVPGEYAVKIKKTGYRDWQKNILVHEQQINHIPVNLDKVYLLLEKNQETAASTTTQSLLVSAPGQISYLENNSSWQIKTLDLTGNEQNQDIKLAQTFTNPEILQKFGSETLISDRGQNWYINSQNPEPLAVNLANPKLAGSNGAIFGIDKQNNLIKLSTQGGSSEILENSIQNFAVAGDGTVYFLTRENQPYLAHLDSAGKTKTKVIETPTFTNSQIIISPANQIFLILDGTLYSINDTLQTINTNVKEAEWLSDANGLFYKNDHEAWLYQPLATGQNQLLARMSEPLGSVVYNPKIGYVFISSGQEIKAFEFDPEGQPNVYTLAQTKTANVAFTVSPDGSTLVYLDGQNLISLKLR